MNLFLDDERDPLDCTVYKKDVEYATLEWFIVRSHDEFVDFCNKKICREQSIA